MTQADWETPLGYYEKAIANLQKTQEELLKELTEIRHLKNEYAQLKQQLLNQKISPQIPINYHSKSLFIKAENWQNATCENPWQPVVKYQLELTSFQDINIIGIGQGYASSYHSPLQIAIFINGAIVDDKWYGVGITHSPHLQSIMTIAATSLNRGNHQIELRYHSLHGNGVNWVHFNGACLVINL
jgi:hypothetical protein